MKRRLKLNRLLFMVWIRVWNVPEGRKIAVACVLAESLRKIGVFRLFGGLVADIKRKLPFYFSDYKDALNLQCLAAFMFMYFAMLAPIVTFGGLLEEATDKRMVFFKWWTQCLKPWKITNYSYNLVV